LQERSSPKAQSRAKPSEKIVAAFVNHKIRAIDEKEPPWAEKA
jgi:hypothetical protein